MDENSAYVAVIVSKLGNAEWITCVLHAMGSTLGCSPAEFREGITQITINVLATHIRMRACYWFILDAPCLRRCVRERHIVPDPERYCCFFPLVFTGYGQLVGFDRSGNIVVKRALEITGDEGVRKAIREISYAYAPYEEPLLKESLAGLLSIPDYRFEAMHLLNIVEWVDQCRMIHLNVTGGLCLENLRYSALAAVEMVCVERVVKLPKMTLSSRAEILGLYTAMHPGVAFNEDRIAEREMAGQQLLMKRIDARNLTTVNHGLKAFLGNYCSRKTHSEGNALKGLLSASYPHYLF